MEATEANLSTRNCSGNLEKFAQNAKKLLEIREVAKKLPSNFWKALTIIITSCKN